MTGDELWVAGIHETAKMSSILGLPTRGSAVTVLITRVHLHPLCMLVEFWGKFSQERTADYEHLAKDIQSPGNTFQEFEGNPGDQCLAQIDGSWYRSRIVSKNGPKYTVFLFDKGMTCSTTASKLTWGRNKNFDLPPEVEFCVLANVLPCSPENRWSPVALEFLKSLSGETVRAHVQDVLVAHRAFVLHIPCISKQMYELGLAKKLSPDHFQDFVLMSLQSQSRAEVCPEIQFSMAEGERLHKKELYLYPELPAGTVESVLVTEVTNPQRVFCQLKVFSQELKKLSEQLTQCCEGRMSSCIVGPEMVGFPCAARGSDGRWHRSVLQRVCPSNKVVEVLNVDYGTKQFVQVQNVRPLASEFFRMPVVTYICSLHGITDKGVGWTTSEIDNLRSLLLHKIVIAKFEYQSISEGVHYVTLYGAENANINSLFGSKESELVKTLGDYAIRTTAYSCKPPALQECNPQKLTPGQAVEGKEGKGILARLPAEDLPLNSSHAAVVQHVSNPSEFWIQTQNYANELDDLMDSIYHLYTDSVNKHVVRNPTVGLYCAAKAEDGEFYRATVTEVGETQIKVFFVDYGNTEAVDRSNIRTLPDKLKKLPCLSLKCTLAGVGPKDGSWSQSACDFFNKAVTDKKLTVHVTAKYEKGYFVQLTDPKAQGERDLATLMCSSGLAERTETQRQPKVKMTTQPAILPQFPDARLSGVHGHKGMPFETTLNTVGPAGNDRSPRFKEHMFSTGSVLDVSVSYIESPNDFWCQLVQNAGHLTLFMRDIQAHYAGSEFQPNVDTACVARHPDNGMWYRAIVIHKHETPDVDVLFVDYGQRETVSVYDLRRISPQFLALQGQAFRCSLLNPVEPTSALNEWDEEAVAMFRGFVEAATSKSVILKCTIYAVMYSEQRILFNIVDLETPFESVCTSMVNLGKGAPPKNAHGPSFHLDTYYYSTHNVKTGTEEQVTVTCVNNVSQFYCHLERNADVINGLKSKLSNLCHQLENVKVPKVFGALCFAKYTDGQWYRGQIKTTKPAILVHFVDYGDVIEVEDSDLLPIPREANDIMSVPVQAVVCSLSDVPADVPSEVNRWFETSATEGKFRALVVAREPDGKLLVELYHGKTQINSKIKKMFQIDMHTEGKVGHQGRRALKASANHTQKTPKVVPKHVTEMGDQTQANHKNVSSTKLAQQMRNGDLNQSAPKLLYNDCKSGQKVRAAPLELYIPPHQRPTCTSTPSNTGNGSEPAGAFTKPRKRNLPTETKELESKSPDTESEKESNAEKIPKLADLPSHSITSDMEVDVYVSHCNSPLSFYVQLLRDEDAIISLVEELNGPQSTPQTNDIKDVHPGDLVKVEFADDSSWYRAVVREIHGTTMAHVEFVDYGNTAMMPISKMGRLQKSFLQFPVYTIHCMLGEAAGLGKEEVLDLEVVSAFKKDIGGVGEKVLKCHFIRQSGSVWEVSLEDGGVNVTCKASTRCSTDGSEMISEELEQAKEQPAQNSDISESENSERAPLNSSLHYHQQELSEGQKLEVYITAINSAQNFWCQPVDSEELDEITSSVSKVVVAVDHIHIDPGSLSPGSPCIALFSDDAFWYRAEVINKDGDELSVLFVDYGNKSQVNITDVREMPPELMKTPAQTFLCELEGFDASRGYWDSGAVDELSALTTDKALQLTVTRVTREEGKVKCFVWLECEGQVINEALKTLWKSSTTENATAETPLQCDSTVKETAPPEDQLKYPKGQDTDTTDAYIHPHGDHSEEQSNDELVVLHTDSLLCDSGIDETTLSLLHNKSDQGGLDLSCDKSAVESDKSTEEEGFSVMAITGPDNLNSPSDENHMEAMEESEIATTDLESLLAEDHTYSMKSSLDVVNISDPTEERDDHEVTIARDHSLPRTTTVKMVSREAFHPKKKSVDLLDRRNIPEHLKQIQTELELPTCVLPVFDTPTEQDIVTEHGVPKEELPCVTTHYENNLITGEENLTHHEDAYSALRADYITAASEPQTCTAPSQDLGDRVEDATCSVEEEVVTCCVEEEATCSVEEVVTCSVEEEEGTCSVEEVVTCSVEEVVTCSVEEVVTCSVEEEATCSDEEEVVTCCVEEEATCSVEEVVTCSVEEEKGTCSVEEVVTCSVEEVVTCSVEEVVTCSVEEEATCSDEEEATCCLFVEEEASCSVEQVATCFLVVGEEATCSVEQVATDALIVEEEATGGLVVEEEATCSFVVEEEEATGALVVEEEATGALVVEEAATGALVVEEEATGALVVEEEATSALVVEEEATCSFVVEEEEATGALVVEEEATGALVVEEEVTGGLVVEEETACSFVVEEEATSALVVEEEATGALVVEEEATCSLVVEEEATCSLVVEEEATCSLVVEEEATCSLVVEEEATCSLVVEEEATCSLVVEDEATCSLVVEEEATCSLAVEEEATCSLVVEEEATCSVVEQEACLLFCTDAFSEQETGNLSLHDEAMHDKNNSVTEDEISALHEDECSALPSDTEPQDDTDSCPDLSNLVEEVTCLVREICLSDDCRDPPQEAEREEMEHLVHTPPYTDKDFSDGVWEAELSPDEDSFAVQLSRITHLSLIINDSSDDSLLVEQQPEE